MPEENPLEEQPTLPFDDEDGKMHGEGDGQFVDQPNEEAGDE